MKNNENVFVKKVMQEYFNSKNGLDVYFTKLIMQQDEPFPFLDEVIQRGFGKYPLLCINKKSVADTLFDDYRLIIINHIKKYIERGELPERYIQENDSITIIQFVFTNRCRHFYKKILKEAGIK